MVTAIIRRSDGSIQNDPNPGAIRNALDDPQALFWVDLEAPTQEEYALLSDVFQFHPLAIEDTIGHLQRPKVEGYYWKEPSANRPPDYYYIVLHSPDLQTFKHHESQEVDIFICERFLVTVHDGPIAAITNRRNKTLAGAASPLDPGPDRLLYMILDEMVDQYQPILDDLSEALDDLDEEAASDSPGRDLPRRISEKKRMLIYLRQLAGPQREVVAQLTRGDVHVIRESTRIYLRDVQDHLIRLYENVELYRDIVMGARDIYLSSISNHLNQIMKTLTIISVIGLPLTVITGFFGMNFDAIPGLHNQLGFWLTVLVMGIVVTGMLWLFKKKRWI